MRIFLSYLIIILGYYFDYALPSVRIAGFLNDMRDVKTIITELLDEVREKNVEPVTVQLQDFIKVVVQEAKNELWELIKKKEVIYHQTLNGHSFSVPEEDNNNTDDEQRTG